LPGFVNRVAVVGVGLIGGSLARALKQSGFAGEVVGIEPNTAERALALQLGVIDRGEATVEEGVLGADVVVLATPVGPMERVGLACIAAMDAGAVLTDVGSVKGVILTALEEPALAAGIRLIGGHPIAGTEHSGVAASFPELFRGARIILTPTPHSDGGAQALVTAMWEAVGGQVETMEAALHDRILGATSHLPHVIAFSLVEALRRMNDGEGGDLFRFAAGGFRDFTRIASSNPPMWRDICLANGESVVEMIDRFTTVLGEVRQAVDRGDADALEQTFVKAKVTRDSLVRRRGFLGSSE